ncbi:MAG: hypothetical protein JKY65_18350 [Planctomycetes bacterium]|nr:hypothetical protein [Planctomycetota bacterium]
MSDLLNRLARDSSAMTMTLSESLRLALRLSKALASPNPHEDIDSLIKETEDLMSRAHGLLQLPGVPISYRLHSQDA